MNYKLLNHNNAVVTISQKPIFLKTIKSANTVLPTTLSKADKVSINGKIYNLMGSDSPLDSSYLIEAIDDDEYEILRSQLIEEKSPQLQKIKNDKIDELSDACNKAIVEGCDINISDSIEHFTFNLEDQLNLNRLMNSYLLNKSQTSVLYHAKDKKIKAYSISDFKKIYKAMTSHIEYHTTYFNLIKNCINNMNNPNEIKNLKYGQDIFKGIDEKIIKTLRR